jgi:hypothetical protein
VVNVGSKLHDPDRNVLGNLSMLGIFSAVPNGDAVHRWRQPSGATTGFAAHTAAPWLASVPW